MTTDLTLTDMQRAALELIAVHQKGREITGRHVANSIGLKSRDSGKEGADIRAVINALRQKGYPICANGKGYYYPQNRSQIEEYEESLRRRIQSENDALGGIQRALLAWDELPEIRNLPEQLSLIEI